MARSQGSTPRPLAVIFGESEYLRAQRTAQVLDKLLPPEVDRGVALAEYDGTRSEEQGGPTLAAVFDDLNTLPFLADRRVVVIRDADRFVTAARDKLETYLQKPSPTAVLVLVCRTFQKTTRLYKAAAALGCEMIECGRVSAAQVERMAVQQAEALGVALDADVARQLVQQVGANPGLIATEVEKLCLYVVDRKAISRSDIEVLVDSNREEQIFGAMDTAAQGRSAEALMQWQQVLAHEPKAVFMAVAGMASKARSWLAGHRALNDGRSSSEIATQMRCFGRADVAMAILRRIPERKVRRLLAAIADLDTQAKSGARSIETGVERILLATAAGP